MSPLWKQDYDIDSSKYEQNNLIFVLTERNSKRSTGSQSQYVYTCYSANNMFSAAGGDAIIPMWQPCAEFSSESKVKKMIVWKNTIFTEDCE